MDKKKYKKTKYPNIYKHIENGTYAVDLSLGYDNLTGKRIRTTKTGIKTEREAKEIIKNSQLSEMLKQDIISKLTFDEAFEKYLYACEYEKKLAYNTLKKRKGFFKTYFQVFFNNAPLTKITKNNCIEFQKYLLKINLSNRTRNDIFSVLAMFFNWCVCNDLLIKSPTKGIVNFTFENTKMEFYPIEEFNQLITYMVKKFNQEQATITMVAILFCRLIYFLGTRPGETHGFKDCDIDYSDYTFEINKSIHFETGKGNVKSNTKTTSSKRTIYSDKKLISYVIEYKKKMFDLFGFTIKEDTYLFTNPQTGKLYGIETIRKEINKRMEEAGVKHIRLHDFRHSHAALLMSQGEELYYIKEDLGHSRYDITVDIYGHLDIKKKKNVAENLGKLM